MGVSFRSRNIYPPEAGKILQSSWNAPKALFMGLQQAEKVTFAEEVLFWGCAGLNFRANLPFGSEPCRRAQVESHKAEGPFNGMRQDFAASERDPHSPT
ncbi:MAG: hypothetical protein V3W19_15625, partial [Desulfatiglandales bacterium]